MNPSTRFNTCADGDPDRSTEAVDQFLQDAIGALEPDIFETGSSGRGRPRILPSLLLWSGMLVCILRGFSSQQALWRTITKFSLWHYPKVSVTDEAVYRRLAKEGLEPLQSLFEYIRDALAVRLKPYEDNSLAPFAKHIFALDATTLDQVARRLPALRGKPPGDRSLLPGKLSTLFNVCSQQWHTIHYVADPCENDKVVARDVLNGIPLGSLILADLGYFAFAWFDDLVDLGFHFVSRLRNKTSYKVLHTYYSLGDTFDGIVQLGAYRADRTAHAVRLVTFRQGGTLFQYITSVTDPKVFPMADIARVYARRWDIEMAFKVIKRHLGLHMLWSAKTTVILQQAYSVLIIAQILHALHVEIAGRAGVDIFDVSLPLLIEYMPLFARNGEDPVAGFVEHGRELRFIRPSRRIKIIAPTIPENRLVPLPPGIEVDFRPRYANRKCGKRSQYAN
jgi:hypothetical protein